MGGVDRKHAGVSTRWGHRLHRLVRVKWLHVAIATVAARAQGVEVAETLIGSSTTGNHDNGTAAEAQQAIQTALMSVIFVIRSAISV